MPITPNPSAAVSVEAYNLKAAIVKSVSDVFDTMLAMEVEFFEQVHQSYLFGRRILASVNIVGQLMGIVNIQVNQNFAYQMTANMLGIEQTEIQGAEEVKDVIGEVCNMVGGNLKSNLCDIGLACQLSTPVFTTGKDYKHESRSMTRHEYFSFFYQEHIILVDVGLKEAEIREVEPLDSEASVKKQQAGGLEQFPVAKSVDTTVPEVFDTMLSMEVIRCGTIPEAEPGSNHILSSISLSGSIQGRINIHASETFSRHMTAAMLGMEPEEIEDMDEVKDVIGEICNMIGGNLKSDLCDAGFHCTLSPPSFTTGVDFETRMLQLSRHEKFAYQYGDQVLHVEIGLEASGN